MQFIIIDQVFDFINHIEVVVGQGVKRKNALRPGHADNQAENNKLDKHKVFKLMQSVEINTFLINWLISYFNTNNWTILKLKLIKQKYLLFH